MSRYVEILGQTGIIDVGQDENTRSVFSANFDAMVPGDVDQFEEEIAKILSDASLGTLGTDMFIGSSAILPATGDGPFVHIISTGGVAPEETHNGSKYEHLSVQVLVRASTYVAARTRALAVWRELDGVRNLTVAA